MCVTVSFTSPREDAPPWDYRQQRITLPAALSNADALTVIRAILTELAVPQPPFGARCWCGAAVELPRVPRQTRRTNMVISHGA